MLRLKHSIDNKARETLAKAIGFLMRNNKLLLLTIGGVVFWLTLTLIFSVSGYIDASRLGQYQPYSLHLIDTAIGFASWGVLAPFLFAAASSQRFVSASFTQKIWFSLLAALFAFVAMMIFVGLVTAPRYDATFVEFVKRQRIVNWLGDMFLFVIVMLVGYIAAVIRQAQQAALQAARLQSTLAQEKADRSTREATYLRGRLGSHFVMNALSNVLGLVRLGKLEQAEDATILLSDILRTMTNEEHGNLVTLAVEIQSAEKYLAFQRIRYPVLESRFYIARAAQNTLVPNQILQPLLENVFKHAKLPEKAVLEVHAALEDDARIGKRLCLSVKNNSDALSENIADVGEGLTLTTLRLQTVMQAESRFERSYNNGWYQVKMILPYMPEDCEAQEESDTAAKAKEGGVS